MSSSILHRSFFFLQGQRQIIVSSKPIRSKMAFVSFPRHFRTVNTNVRYLHPAHPTRNHSRCTHVCTVDAVQLTCGTTRMDCCSSRSHRRSLKRPWLATATSARRFPSAHGVRCWSLASGRDAAPLRRGGSITERSDGDGPAAAPCPPGLPPPDGEKAPVVHQMWPPVRVCGGFAHC